MMSGVVEHVPADSKAAPISSRMAAASAPAGAVHPDLRSMGGRYQGPETRMEM